MKHKIIGAVASILVIGLVAFAYNSRAEDVGAGVGVPATVFNNYAITNVGAAVNGGTNRIVSVGTTSLFSVSVISSNSSATTSNSVVFIEGGNLNVQNAYAWRAVGTLPTLVNVGTLAAGTSSNFVDFGFHYIRVNYSNGTDNAGAQNTNFVTIYLNTKNR